MINKEYRRRPEKLGKQISLIRFLFMGMDPSRFEKNVLCELTPPLGESNRSEFWEALGRRFTGLPYQEADLISQQNKEFISSLFPHEDIYLALLDSRARLVLGRVGQETRAAQHLLEMIGFTYRHEVDPFDGGPHFGAALSDITIVKNGRWAKLVNQDRVQFENQHLVGILRDGEFKAAQCAAANSGENISLHCPVVSALEVDPGDKLFYSKI